MNISILPRGHIHSVLPHIIPYVTKAVEWSLGRMCTDDIVASMFSMDVQTWILFDDDSVVHGYLTTQMFQYPQVKHFAVLNCGGRDGALDECVDLVFDTFEQYARQSGCDGIEIIGRPAWWKHIKDRGYEQPQRQYFKSFKE